MAGIYCHVSGPSVLQSGRLQVPYEVRNGDPANASVLIESGVVGIDVSSLSGSTPAQKRDSLLASLTTTFTQIVSGTTASSAALNAVNAVLIGFNVPAAP